MSHHYSGPDFGFPHGDVRLTSPTYSPDAGLVADPLCREPARYTDQDDIRL